MTWCSTEVPSSSRVHFSKDLGKIVFWCKSKPKDVFFLTFKLFSLEHIFVAASVLIHFCMCRYIHYAGTINKECFLKSPKPRRFQFSVMFLGVVTSYLQSSTTNSQKCCLQIVFTWLLRFAVGNFWCFWFGHVAESGQIMLKLKIFEYGFDPIFL